MEVHLVADTNLFFECKALEELHWETLGYDTIVILLTKPVLDEIDKHKKANGRTRKRAVEIFQRVRGMLEALSREEVVREASPKVVLRLMSTVAPDEAHRGALDYSKNDDRLIGILATLRRGTLHHDIMLFTDDTGPAATAHGLDLPFKMIDKTWRRPAEESTEDKKIRELEKDLAAYRSQEPNIVIDRCVPADENGNVTVIRKIAQPLTEAEVENVLDALRHKHPMKTEFSAPPRNSSSILELATGHRVRFDPPDESEVNNYQKVLYPKWIEECRKILLELHNGRNQIEPPLILRWEMANVGTRPASIVRIQFDAFGPLEIRRLPDEDEDDEAEGEAIADVQSASTGTSMPRFPAVPSPPAFKKVVEQITPLSSPRGSGCADILGSNAAALHGYDKSSISAASKIFSTSGMDKLLNQWNDINKTLGASGILGLHAKASDATTRETLFRDSLVSPVAAAIVERPFDFSRSIIPQIAKRDPEEFYYHEWPTENPVKKGILTRDLWRHQDGTEVFEFEVVFIKEGEVGGSILCTVHTKELTNPKTSRVSIKRKFESFTPLEIARSMVEAC